MKKAQAEIISSGVLASLGDNYAKVKDNELIVLEAILLGVGLDFNFKIKEYLTKANAISSGGLFDISVPQVYPKGNGYVLEVGYPITSKQAKYYDFVNKGVKGVGGKNARPKPNTGDYSFKTIKPGRSLPAAIISWLKKGSKSAYKYTPISTLESKNQSLKKLVTEAENKKRLAFAISTNIKKNGLRATRYFDDAVKVIFNQDFQDSLAVALKGDITIQIKKTWQLPS